MQNWLFLAFKVPAVLAANACVRRVLVVSCSALIAFFAYGHIANMLRHAVRLNKTSTQHVALLSRAQQNVRQLRRTYSENPELSSEMHVADMLLESAKNAVDTQDKLSPAKVVGVRADTLLFKSIATAMLTLLVALLNRFSG